MDLDASTVNAMLEGLPVLQGDSPSAAKKMGNANVKLGWSEGKNMIYQVTIVYHYDIIYQYNIIILERFLFHPFRQCNDIQNLYYLPTFHQFKLEIEDGYREDGNPVRIGYKDEEFPGYSWRGYGTYSQLQEEVRV